MLKKFFQGVSDIAQSIVHCFTDTFRPVSDVELAKKLIDLRELKNENGTNRPKLS